jgi:NodT family efflux transporter outer membrane factor (OMF) lipoprotein
MKSDVSRASSGAAAGPARVGLASGIDRAAASQQPVVSGMLSARAVDSRSGLFEAAFSRPRPARRRMRAPLASATLIASVLVAGCAVGPKYVKPDALPPAPASAPGGEPQAQAMPSAYSEGEGWKPAQPADQALRGAWWEVFNDAELNALESRISVSNQTLKAAEARFRQARALVRVNRAAQFPTVRATPSLGNQRLSANRPNVPPGAATANSGDFVLAGDVSYEVDVWGRVRKTVEAARAEAQASAADLESVSLSLHAELALNYLSLRSLDAQQKLLDESVTAFERALELTQNRYKGGIASGSDVAQARTQLETTRAQAVDIGVQRAQFEHAIAILVGQTPETLKLAAKPWEQPPPGVPVGVPSALLERRPDIAAAERRVAEANAQIGIARTAFFPTLLLGARAGFEASSIGDWFNWPSRLWSIGPSAVQTLFDGGRRRAVSDAVQASYDATVATYRDTVLNAFGDVEDGIAALRILEHEAGVQQAAVDAAQESLMHAENRYKGGLANYLEVTTAQSIALNNQRTAVGLLQRRMTTTVLLIKSLGGGWDASQLPTDFTSSAAPAASGASARQTTATP